MKIRTLERKTIINNTISNVFDFFSKPENLNLLTPPNLHFKIISSSAVPLQKGSIIQYQLKLYSVPFKWKTEISQWEPPYFFEDTQLKGPYRLWKHQHLFYEQDGKVLMIDKLQYLSPGWILEPFIHHLFVQREVNKIFDYRERSLTNIFNS